MAAATPVPAVPPTLAILLIASTLMSLRL